MRFEYDEAKSNLNPEKHGIDFDEAQELWDDPYRIEYAVETRGEKRFVVVARLLDGRWAAICTMRGEAVRIISARRATREEVSEYDRAGNDS